jgi:Transglycosylase SLT domain
MGLDEFHGFADSVRWRVVTAGVEIEGSGVERTRGQPRTVTKVWEAYSSPINVFARTCRVPCAIVVATIAVESAGRPDALRLEPGYVSDDDTPARVSAGLMQTLISTARAVMRRKVDRAWLLEPKNSIDAGTSYMHQQAHLTGLDPPLVAAAYNSGGLHHQPGAQNRWKLRQFPIGTGQYCDRFVRFYNDAVFVMARHRVRPTVPTARLPDAVLR